MKKPALVVVCGPPCGGKSAIARQLAAHLKLAHLEMDAIRFRLIPESRQREADRDIAYRAMHYCAELLLRLQEAVVLDATYTRSPQRRELKNLADRVGAHVYLIQCSTSPEVAVARLQTRQPGEHPAVDLTSEGVRTAALQFPYSDEALLLRSDVQEIDACVAAAASYLDSATPFKSWSWICYAPDTSVTDKPNVSADSVYQEWYNELRRYRDYENGIVAWASTILVALAGGLAALFTSDRRPLLTVWQFVVASVLILAFAGVAGWIAQYVGERYRELRKEAAAIQPDWKQDLDKKFVADLHRFRNPLQAQMVLLAVLWCIVTGILWLFVGESVPHNQPLQPTSGAPESHCAARG